MDLCFHDFRTGRLERRLVREKVRSHRHKSNADNTD
jgi:hypothetical protein